MSCDQICDSTTYVMIDQAGYILYVCTILCGSLCSAIIGLQDALVRLYAVHTGEGEDVS